MLTWAAVYVFIKFWLPMATFLGLLVKGAQMTGRQVSSIASTFLDNHMQHIQESAETASAAVVELAGYHKEMLESQGRIVTSIEGMSRDFHEHVHEDRQAQAAILTGIEVLKDRA